MSKESARNINELALSLILEKIDLDKEDIDTMKHLLFSLRVSTMEDLYTIFSNISGYYEEDKANFFHTKVNKEAIKHINSYFSENINLHHSSGKLFILGNHENLESLEDCLEYLKLLKSKEVDVNGINLRFNGDEYVVSVFYSNLVFAGKTPVEAMKNAFKRIEEDFKLA